MSETSAPGSVRAFARDPEGTETDITEGVQALYDLVTSSMNWGSGFWTAEDAAPVAKLARLMGFKGAAEAERYLKEQLHSEEQARFLRDHPEALRFAGTGTPAAHDHVFSPAGRCMWRFCKVEQSAAGTVLTSADPEPPAGTVVRDDCGLTWERDWDGGNACWSHPGGDGDHETWTKIAGNYGPVTVLEVPED